MVLREYMIIFRVSVYVCTTQTYLARIRYELFLLTYFII